MDHPQNDAMLILERGNELLLARRHNTGYADGRLNLPSGKVDPGEDPYDAAVREAREEIGIHLDRDTIRLVHTMYFRNPEGRGRIGWFFAVDQSLTNEPVNAEPHKCSELLWQPADHLPADTVRYNALGIQHYLKGEPHSVHWHDWRENSW